MIEADQVLVGRNATRRAYNMRMRQRRGFTGELPATGDKLVCLRNNKRKGLFNGGLWSVKEKPAATRATSSRCGCSRTRASPARASRFRCGRSASPAASRALEWPMRKRFDEFDYGYVLTVHKAQGSQWDDVVLFDESAVFAESRQRWLYTGVTRAAKRLTVVM